MKFAFSLKNKLKIAILLFCIMCCTLLIRFLEDKSVKKINESFISMYNDRLVPATDLYFVAEHLYYKNLILQETLISESNTANSNAFSLITSHNNKIDSVINKYQLTFLVREEQLFLNDLKNAIAVQLDLESKILSLTKEKGKVIYDSVGQDASAKTMAKLSALVKIQSKVGNELIKNTEIFISGTKIYSTLQVILAIIIGVMIVAIIAASNAVKINNEKFNLN